MSELITGKKSETQLENMRKCGKILAQIYEDVRNFVHVGVSEKEVDAFVEKKIKEYGASPTYKTPEVNFPGVICISTNEQVVHSVPSDYVFEKGDVVSFDLVITYKDMKTDSAFTMVIDDEPKGAVKMLLNTTKNSLEAGINSIHGDGTTVYEISSAIEDVLKRNNLGIFRELVGHGVGLMMHMPPDVPNYRINFSKNVVLHEGDTIAIEPMACLGKEKIVSDDDGDGWTISTKDGSLAAHFEHTVLITKDGVEVLTQK